MQHSTRLCRHRAPLPLSLDISRACHAEDIIARSHGRGGADHTGNGSGGLPRSDPPSVACNEARRSGSVSPYPSAAQSRSSHERRGRWWRWRGGRGGATDSARMAAGWCGLGFVECHAREGCVGMEQRAAVLRSRVTQQNHSAREEHDHAACTST